MGDRLKIVSAFKSATPIFEFGRESLSAKTMGDMLQFLKSENFLFQKGLPSIHIFGNKQGPFYP